MSTEASIMQLEVETHHFHDLSQDYIALQKKDRPN